NRLLRDEIEFDDHALATLRADRRGKRLGVFLAARRHDGEKAFLREFLRDRAADPPAHTDLDIAVVDRVTVRQNRVAPVRLPFRRRTEDDADILAPTV